MHQEDNTEVIQDNSFVANYPYMVEWNLKVSWYSFLQRRNLFERFKCYIFLFFFHIQAYLSWIWKHSSCQNASGRIVHCENSKWLYLFTQAKLETNVFLRQEPTINRCTSQKVSYIFVCTFRNFLKIYSIKNVVYE